MLEILKAEHVSGFRVVLVVSALKDQTNQLIEIAKSAIHDNYREQLRQLEQFHRSYIEEIRLVETKESCESKVADLLKMLAAKLHEISTAADLSERDLDEVSSFGELLSSTIVSFFIQEHYLGSSSNEQSADFIFLDSRDLIRTDNSFGAASVDILTSYRNIQSALSTFDNLALLAGYIGSTPDDRTTTLGRGGSDYTAALVGAALDAEEIHIWTHVDGVMTADPSKVKKAFTIPYLSYAEAMEMCHFGARIIYPRTIQPAREAAIPIVIRNAQYPQRSGTTISARLSSSSFSITGIASINETTLIRLEGPGMVGVSGIAGRLFDALAAKKISVTLISQASSEQSICFAVEPNSKEQAIEAISVEFATELEQGIVSRPLAEEDQSIVAVVGAHMRHTPGISAKVFRALGANGINVNAIAQGSSELNISIVVDRENETKSLYALHDTFFLSEHTTLHLFLVGVGQVGKELLSQIEGTRASLAEKKLELSVVGLANSRRMTFSDIGIMSSNWLDIDKWDLAFSLDDFIKKMKQLNLPNSVFVDCTASGEVATHYSDILRSSISIVTPNKRANSDTLDIYQLLKEQTRRANVRFFYETNVGAGLPVIGTLQDLLASGDEILQIEAVLSGTLSYIFNSFDGEKSFSEIVALAKDQGYTEPDPRDDLSGTDVARKLLILAREIGIPMELGDIEVESLIPEQCANADSIDDFMSRLPDADSQFEKQRSSAAEKGAVLRYIGTIENGSAKVAIKAVDSSHPFYNLSGSDNIISFVTKRYYTRPLVIKGPGAGTEVTAAGVLADIIRVSSYVAH